MRVNGSPAWLYKRDGKELREFEAELDRVFTDISVIASCTYPLAESRGIEMLDIAHTHRFVIARRQGVWEVLETPELIQAKREIKGLNEKLEQRVIERTAELAAANEALRREITERKQAEAALQRSEDRLRLVIETIPAMVFTALPDGSVDFVNQRWLQYMGLSLEDVRDWGWKDTIHPEDRDRSCDHWRAAMAAGQPTENELRVRRADGVYHWILGRFVPLRDESGKIVKWYGVSTDIDNRKRAEEQLKRSNEELHALSARLQSVREEETMRIAREIHDELGATLSSLRWDLEEVEEIVSESADLSPLTALRQKIAALVRLAETIIDTVRRIASELRPTALDEFGLSAALQWHAQQFQARTGIVVDCDCSLDNLDLNREQATAIFRIFQEALTNALRHAQATRVEVVMKQAAGDFVLTISDNGKGITEAEKSVRSSLGLLGMRERAHLIGGEIEIAGAAGRGTVITLRVPIPAAPK